MIQIIKKNELLSFFLPIKIKLFIYKTKIIIKKSQMSIS